ncbi:exocyst complex component 6B-like isoform X7 [Tachypleus tridentatus]|uniref:exocyst complex component 6B-like isoform X7 n=1 Tax=Tachypleus tridentatus TaxID=6853 RepID=UPI003FD2F452
MCFADLRQNLINEHQLLFFKLLDLFMTWDWSTYFYDYGQENSKYLKVNPQVAVVLLEKGTMTDGSIPSNHHKYGGMLDGERSRQEEKCIFSIKKESTRQEEVGRNCPKTYQTVNIKQ